MAADVKIRILSEDKTKKGLKGADGCFNEHVVY